MNDTIRCFIAMELTPAIQDKLDNILKILKQNFPQGIRWVPASNIHLTLKFLGDVNTDDIDPLKRVLELAASGFRPFSVSLGGLSAFPGLAKPRVIWIGLNTPPEISYLAKKIDVETEKLGYQGESRPFTPHLTLGRASKTNNSSQIYQLSAYLKEKPFQLNHQDSLGHLTLFRSSLTPSGAIYSKVYSIELIADK